MHWNLKKIGEYKITSDAGYTISFCEGENGVKKRFAAWPPTEEGVLVVQGGKELPYKKAIDYSDFLDEAKYFCEKHYAEANDLEPPAAFVAPEKKPEVNREVTVPGYEHFDKPLDAANPADLAPPAPAGYTPPKQPEKPKKDGYIKPRGKCETAAELMHYHDMSQKQADKVIESRAEKKYLREQAGKAANYLSSMGIEGYNFSRS